MRINLCAAIAILALSASLWCCSGFEESPTPAGSDGGPDGTSSSSGSTSSSGSSSGSVDQDSGADARPPPEIHCNGALCAANEICCLFKASIAGLTAECNEGTDQGDCAPGKNQNVVLVSTCDDALDCAPGQVCCHKFDSCAPTRQVQSVTCTPSGSCLTCDQIGTNPNATGLLACNPELDGSCPTGFVCDPVPTAQRLVAQGYCVKQ